MFFRILLLVSIAVIQWLIQSVFLVDGPAGKIYIHHVNLVKRRNIHHFLNSAQHAHAWVFRRYRLCFSEHVSSDTGCTCFACSVAELCLSLATPWTVACQGVFQARMLEWVVMASSKLSLALLHRHVGSLSLCQIPGLFFFLLHVLMTVLERKNYSRDN